MGVQDGQNVDAATTNPAFLDANADDTALGKIGFNDAAGSAVSGTNVVNIQREVNALWSFIDGLINQAKTYVPTWASNNFGSSALSVKAKIEAIDAAFSSAGTQFVRNDHNVIGSGVATKVVTFSSAFPTNDYSVEVAIENLVDTSPIFLQWIITARTTTGFTVVFNAPTDSANYVLHYAAKRPL